jgi:hypothetical protein
MKHKVHIDNYQFQTKPNTYDACGISKRICEKSVMVSLSDLAKAIQKGQTVVLSTSSTGERLDRDFEQSSLVAIDLDNSINPYELKKTLQPSLMYYSFSHQIFGKANSQDCDKPGWNYRAIWQLESIITDRERYKKLVSALIFMFQSDVACKDSLRVFYGSKPNSVISFNDAIFLTDVEVEQLIKSLPVNHKRKPRATNKHDSLDDLAQHQKMLLVNKLKSFRDYLINNEESRYEKLRAFLGVLFNIEFLSPELANDIAIDFIDGDAELSELYSEDKYTKLLEDYILHLEAKYGQTISHEHGRLTFY